MTPEDHPRSAERSVHRCIFMDALGDYIDARIQYDRADPEWRTGAEVSAASDRLEEALDGLLEEYG